MSKLFEGMKQVHRDRQSTCPAPARQLRIVPAQPLGFEAELLTLYRSLDSHLGDLAQKVILFLGVQAGEGTSTVVSNLGRVVAEQFNRKVAVLDADIANPVQHRLLAVTPSVGWDDVLTGGQPAEKSIYPTPEDRLSLVPVSTARAGSTRVIDAEAMQELFAALRERFDLILVDCAPATDAANGIALSQNADAVVLVLSPESTRWPVAQTVRLQVEQAGGRIVGAILNKRRFYIPAPLYGRL